MGISKSGCAYPARDPCGHEQRGHWFNRHLRGSLVLLGVRSPGRTRTTDPALALRRARLGFARPALLALLLRLGIRQLVPVVVAHVVIRVHG